MGHKVSTFANSSSSATDEAPNGSTCRRMSHRKVGMALLAMTVTASTVDGFAPPVVTASPSHRHSPTLGGAHKYQQRRRATHHSYASSASLAEVLLATSNTATSSSSSTHEPQQIIQNSASWKRRLLPRKVRIRQLRKQQQHQHDQDLVDYERRKQQWAARYTSVDALRATFGANSNPYWGDLDATTARRLYKTLLPRALMALYRMGVHPEDLAPLAYQARVAAKLYARERCIVPSRLFAMTYDGVRQWKRYGKFQVKGMTYDQVWDKYKQLIHDEEENLEDLTERDVTAKICLKILERSCQTNAHIDRLFLRDFHDPAELQAEERDIDSLTEQLELDVRAILDEATGQVGESGTDVHSHKKEKSKELSAQKVFTLRMVARAKHRMQRLGNLAEEQDQDKKKHTAEEIVTVGSLPPRYWKERSSKASTRRRLWHTRTHPNRSP